MTVSSKRCRSPAADDVTSPSSASCAAAQVPAAARDMRRRAAAATGHGRAYGSARRRRRRRPRRRGPTTRRGRLRGSIRASKTVRPGIHGPRRRRRAARRCHGPGEAHVQDPEERQAEAVRQALRQGSQRRRARPATTAVRTHSGRGASTTRATSSCVTVPQRPQPKSLNAQLKAPTELKHVPPVIATRWRSSTDRATCRCAKARWSARRATTRTGRPMCGCSRTGNGINETCTNCHAEKRGPYLFEHAGISGDSCATCHDPHGSSNDRMLVAKLPFLCQRCHAHTRHPRTIYDNRVLETSNRLYSRGCVTCHSAIHGSNHPAGSSSCGSRGVRHAQPPDPRCRPAARLRGGGTRAGSAAEAPAD